MTTDAFADGRVRTIASEPASRRQRRIATAVVAVVVALSILSLPIRGTVLGSWHAFIPTFGGLAFAADLVTAMLLFTQYSLDGLRLSLAAGSAYLLDALLTVAYVLYFPGAFDVPALAAYPQASLWIWTAWHALFGVIVAFAVLERRALRPASSRTGDILRCAALVVATALATTAAATYFRARLPDLLDGPRFLPLFRFGVAPAVAAIDLAAALVVLRARGLSQLRLWIGVSAIVSGLDLLLNAVVPARYTASWYIGKVDTLTCSSVVLLAFLFSTVTLYNRTTLLAARLTSALTERRSLQEKLEREHAIASTLQTMMMPRELPRVDGLALSTLYRPAVDGLLVGGDWYDAYLARDGRLVLTIGDVAGKGLEASTVMTKVRQSLRVAAQLRADPVWMLDAADTALRDEHPSTMVTAFVALIDAGRERIEWSSAGHPPPFVRRRDGAFAELGDATPPLGLRDAGTRAGSAPFGAGDFLVAYTDGLIEEDRDVVAGLERLRAAIGDDAIRLAVHPAAALHERLLAHGAKDDVAIVTLSLAAAQAHARPIDAAWSLETHDADRAGVVRAAVCAALRGDGASDAELFDVELIFSELLGNAVRHAPGTVEVALAAGAAGTVGLHVLDRGSGFEAGHALPGDDAEAGRGLVLVRALADDLRVSPRRGGGSDVRAVLPYRRSFARADAA